MSNFLVIILYFYIIKYCNKLTDKVSIKLLTFSSSTCGGIGRMISLRGISCICSIPAEWTLVHLLLMTKTVWIFIRYDILCQRDSKLSFFSKNIIGRIFQAVLKVTLALV